MSVGPQDLAPEQLPGVCGDFILPGKPFSALHLSEKGMTSSGHVSSAQVVPMAQVVGSLSAGAGWEGMVWGAGGAGSGLLAQSHSAGQHALQMWCALMVSQSTSQS